ncbi:6,7-dimethyl-8-ribityllumazine synthase [Pseudomonas synxantha]|nr:6,7-dimethyl-8-ribityllumazine synthase [Pseudomonas synxantha]
MCIARERLAPRTAPAGRRQGQQTRCDPGADGHSPDEERTGLAPKGRALTSCLHDAVVHTLKSHSIHNALFFS